MVEPERQQTARATFKELRDASHDALDPQFENFFEPDEELVYQIHTPANIDSARPPGVLIYISPKPGSRMPQDWAEVLDRHNLIWVGAENSGNEIHIARRVGLALLATVMATRLETIDTSRMVLAGFSGGGRVASMMMPVYPELFAGAIFICGANPLFNAEQSTIDALQQLPMVFLTGTGDFNLEDTQMAISTYRNSGLARTELMIVDGLDHALPLATDIDLALDKLS